MIPTAPTSRVSQVLTPPPDVINKEIYYMDIPTNTPIYKSDHSLFGFTTAYSSRPTWKSSGTRFIKHGERTIALEALIKYEFNGDHGEGYVIHADYKEH